MFHYAEVQKKKKGEQIHINTRGVRYDNKYKYSLYYYKAKTPCKNCLLNNPSYVSC